MNWKVFNKLHPIKVIGPAPHFRNNPSAAYIPNIAFITCNKNDVQDFHCQQS